MKIYRLISTTHLFSFGDNMGDVPVLGKSLYSWQKKAVEINSCEITNINSLDEIDPKEDYLIFENNILFNDFLIKICLEAAKNTINSLQFFFDQNKFNQRYLFPSSLDLKQLRYIPIRFNKAYSSTISNYVIPQNVFSDPLYLPESLIAGGEFHMAQSDVFAITIDSPFQLLMANLAQNLSRFYKLKNKIPKFLQNSIGNRQSKWYYRGLKRLNKKGKNCRIHPSAIIEGSIIGDNVSIGANTIVRFSYIQKGTVIADNVSVINCVLGEKTHISNSNYVNSILTYEEVFLIHGPYQFSVFGYKSACFAVINCDIRLDEKTIKIPSSMGIIDSDQRILGVAYGHKSKTGGGNIVAAGRIVPNDKIITPPDNIILNFNF